MAYCMASMQEKTIVRYLLCCLGRYTEEWGRQVEPRLWSHERYDNYGNAAAEPSLVLSNLLLLFIVYWILICYCIFCIKN